MVWAGFSSSGQLTLAFVSSKMDSTQYIKVLSDNLLPFIQQNPQKNFQFQQDNAAIHKSRATMGWLSNNNIRVLPWPACSPDLNPVENLWGLIVRKIYSNGKQYKTVSELKTAIQDSWDNISAQTLQNLVDSVRNRLLGVISLKGGPTRY